MDALTFVRRLIVKTRLFKWLLTATVICCFSLVATNVTAKKPPKPPKPTPEVCTNVTVPDYVFWRDSHTDQMAQVSIYAAQSDTGCEVKLLDIPLPDGPMSKMKLAYSSGESDGVFMGRVIWRIHYYYEPQSVWKYDFTIEEGQIVSEPDEPTRIMNYEDVETGLDLDINDLDLSPDMQSLVYRLSYFRVEDPDYFRIFTLDIADCIEDVCPFGYGQQRYFIERGTDTVKYLRSPVWGPLGDRIYFIERENDTHYVKYIDVSSTQTTPKTLFSTENGERMHEVSSGITGTGEHLALEIGNDPLIRFRCRNIYTLNVKNCEELQNCELNRVFAGIYPSWSRDGNLIHTYHGLKFRRNCSAGKLGLWDGSNLGILTEGYEPEAAGG